MNAAPVAAAMQSSQHSRTRTVQLTRSRIGFGFTINGQAPCMLSCIVPGSPADAAALRPGDALLGVNGTSVHGLAHDDVAAVIARCGGVLTLLVAPSNQAILQPPPPPPPLPPRSVTAAADPRIIGPEARYEQVTGSRGRQQQRSRRSNPQLQPHRRRVICRHKFVLSYIGSLSIPPIPAGSDSNTISTRALAAAVARLKTEARGVTLATLDINDEDANDSVENRRLDNELEDSGSSTDENSGGIVSIVLTSCSGRCLFRLSTTHSSSMGSSQALLLAGRHSLDAAYFGLLAGGVGGSPGLTVHGFYANSQLAASHCAHSQWAAAFGIVCGKPSSSSSCCCDSFPPDSAPVLTALRPLSAWRVNRRRSSQASSTTTSISTASRSSVGLPLATVPMATFKVPLPPPMAPNSQQQQPPPPPQSPSSMATTESLLRRFARGASGSFRRLRRRSMAMSTESLTSNGSDLDIAPSGAIAAATPDRYNVSSSVNQRHQQHQQQQPQQQLNSSLASSERNLSALGAEPEPQAASSVAKWATGLRHLLADPAGVRVFTDFLRLEFSDENIAFWLAVETFRRLDDAQLIQSTANSICATYVGPNAPSSVNIDSCTVASIQACLSEQQQPPMTLFDAAQQHIFNLMRMDSYARFLKSQLYKDCLLCELQSRPLPLAANDKQQQQQQQQQQKHNLVKTSSATRSVVSLSGSTDSSGNKQQQPQQRSGRGFLASLMRGRSSKRYSKMLNGANDVDQIASSASSASASSGKVDLLVGFRLPQTQLQQQQQLRQRSGSESVGPVSRQSSSSEAASVWLAVRANAGELMRDAIKPACLRYGLASDGLMAVPVDSAATVAAADAVLLDNNRRLTSADHRRQFAIVCGQDLLVDPTNSSLTQLLGGCQWSAKRMSSTIDSGLVVFDSEGICELQAPSTHGLVVAPVTSSPRRPASALPWQQPSALAQTATVSKVSDIAKDDSLVELLARVQGSRMEDQRGRIDARHLELPAFLRLGGQTAKTTTYSASCANGDKENASPSPHRPLRGRCNHHALQKSSPSKISIAVDTDSQLPTARSSTPSPTTHILLLASPSRSTSSSMSTSMAKSLDDNYVAIAEPKEIEHCCYEYKADRV